MPTTPHLHILAEAAPLLASLDLDEALRRLEHLVVPEIADWCAIHLVDDEGRIARIEVTHRDPTRAAFALELQRRYPPAPESSLVYDVMRAGRGSVIPEVTDEMLIASSRGAEHLRDMRTLNIQSVIVVPLRARGRTLGAMTLLTEHGGRVYDEKWLALAESMAALAALAVHNTRLYTEVTRARSRMEAILRGVPEGIAVQDDEERLVFANQAAAQVLCCETVEELLSIPLRQLMERLEVVDAQGAPLPFERLPGTRAMRGEEEPSELVRFRIPATGEVRWSRLAASRLPDEADGRALAVNVIQDVTEHVAYERNLVDAAAEAEQASAAKTQFLAVVSHELRTPLNAISGFTELLAMQVAGAMNEAQMQYLARIDTSTRHLTGLIEQILMFSRIETGREDLNLELIDVGALALEVTDILEPLAARQGLTLDRSAEYGRLHAHVDAPRLRQILLNLIGNAIKFTDNGSVTVTAVREDEQVVVRIADTGLGIPPGELERIFEPFTQVDASATRRIGGTGLGLAVSRHLARLMGGDIQVESRLGEGSCFKLYLPAVAPGSSPPASA